MFFSFKGSVTITPILKGARTILSIDNKVTHGVVAEVKVVKSKVGVTYTPVLEIRHFGLEPVKVTGMAMVGRFRKKVVLEVKVDGLSDIPPTLKGLVMIQFAVDIRIL